MYLQHVTPERSVSLGVNKDTPGHRPTGPASCSSLHTPDHNQHTQTPDSGDRLAQGDLHGSCMGHTGAHVTDNGTHYRHLGGEHLQATQTNTFQVMGNVDHNHRLGATNNSVDTRQCTETTAVKSELQVLGETFATWFYDNVNSHNPILQKAAMDFGPHHFWDDVVFILSSKTPDPSEERFEGPLLVSQRFLAFAREEQLLFNPNVSLEGVYVKSDTFGLVMVLVCGTIHRGNDCLGVFQQMFGLVKDPRFENNYKVKKTQLQVNTSKNTSMPKLEGNKEEQIWALVPH